MLGDVTDVAGARISLCVSLSVCIKNIFTTAGSHSGQLQCSIWACTHLLVRARACVCLCVWRGWGGSGGVQVIYILACRVSVNGACCVWQW